MHAQYRLTIVFVLLALCSALPTGTVKAQKERTPRVRFDIQIFDVDLSKGTADVNITLVFGDLVVQEPVESIVAVISNDAEDARIACNVSISGDFVGSSGVVSWTLGGELGRGEYAPFERYELWFQLKNILPGAYNMSQIEIDQSNSFSSFQGPKKSLLRQVFDVRNSATLVLEMSFPSHLGAVTYLRRKSGAFGIPTLFWSLLTPIIACYYLLVSTLLLRGKNATSNRLQVYIALFFFSPAFLMAIQGFLPLRAMLSIPEVLLVNLMISTAIFAIFGLLSAESKIRELARDGFMLFSSFFVTSFLLIYLLPVFPTAALFVFQSMLIAYAGLALSIWTAFLGREIGSWIRNLSKRERRMMFSLAILGLGSVEIGFSSAALQFFNATALVVGAPMGAAGVLILWVVFERTHRTPPPPSYIA